MSQQQISRRFFGLALGAMALGGATQARAQVAPSSDEALWRGLEFEDQAGTTFQIRERPGAGASLTLVKLWAHWCPACLSEMAALTALSSALGPHALDVLLVSHPEYWAQDQAVAHRRGLPFRLATPTAANGSAVVRAALTRDGAYAVPRSMAFRVRDGSMAWKREGSMDWASSAAVAAMKALAA